MGTAVVKLDGLRPREHCKNFLGLIKSRSFCKESKLTTQRSSGNSYLPTGNYGSGASLQRSNLTLVNMTPFHSAHSQYVQGSEQRSSQSTNLSLPTIVNPTLENSAATHLLNVSESTSFSNWTSATSLANGSTIYQPAIIPRNNYSYWIPAAILVNALPPVPPIMHAPSFFLPLPHSPWHWTYNSIQVPSMYPMSGTIGNGVILRQDSLPLVPTYQFPQISLVGGAARVITGENMVNFNFPVQQLNFPIVHTPRFMGDYFWHPQFLRGVNPVPGPSPLHPYSFNMALNGGGQNGMPQTIYVDVDNMSYESLLAFQNRVGFVSTGLSKEVICARLKCTKYQPVEKSEDENDMCIICLEDFSDGQIIGYSDCGHKFHSDCITKWLMQKNSCPFCRRTILTI